MSELAIKNAVWDSTELSPAFVIYGQSLRMPLDLLEFRVIVPERFSICRTSSSWCTNICCKPKRSRSGILMGTAERLCIRLGNRYC